MKEKKIIIRNRLFVMLIIIASLFMGIGYASINSVTMDISGDLIAKEQTGVYIKNVEYISSNNVNLELNEINNYYQTMLNSTITLSNSDTTSSITYLITIYNNSNENYFFKEVLYSDEFYDNNDIIYSLDGISKGDMIKPHSNLSFLLTFKYSNNTSKITNNVLNSYLNFKFSVPSNLKSASFSSYTGEFWGYKNSITDIIFQDEIKQINDSISFDVSLEQDESVMSYLVLNDDKTTYTLYLQSDFLISTPVNSSYLFSNFKKLKNIENINYLDTSNTINMRNMFSGNSSLINLDLSSFNTSNVTNMESMFRECSNLINLNLSNFDTSKVTNMAFMFYSDNKITNLNVSSFDTSNVSSMSYMFDGLHSITSLDLSHFNTSKVENMSFMFYDCPNLKDLNISSFNTTRVDNMVYMFGQMKAITSLDLRNFNTSKVTNMAFMFYNCNNLIDLNISNFDTSNVTNMNCMFLYCSRLKLLDLSSFDMSKVTNTSTMLSGTNSVVNAYAKTQNDADKLNAISGKPSTYSFVVKN